MTDPVLTKTALRILKRVAGSGLERKTLFAEMEIAADRPLTTQQCEDIMVFATDRGLVSSLRDDFDQTRYTITPKGSAQV